MLKGAGRHMLSNGSFVKKPNLGEARATKVGEFSSYTKEQAYGYESTPGGGGSRLPDNTTLKSFASPLSVPLSAGLIQNNPTHA